MNSIELAIWASLALGAFAFYMARTYELALLKREKLAELVESIRQDETLPIELKRAGMAIFTLSLDQNAILKIVWRLIKNRSKKYETTLSNEHQKLLQKMVNEHFFIINFLRAPHWYVLLFIVLLAILMGLLLFFFATKGILKLIKPFESFTDPVCVVAREY